MNTAHYIVLLVEEDQAVIDMAQRDVLEHCPEISLQVMLGYDAMLVWLSRNTQKDDQTPHIIILDLQFPKLDGLAVLRRLRLQKNTCDIPIVAYSSVYTQADVVMSYQVGANSFVPKPIDLEKITELIHDRLAYWRQSHRYRLVSHADTNLSR